MADGPISGFSTLAGSAVDQAADSIPIIDNSAVGAAKNKRMTFAEFFTSRTIATASLTGITTTNGASVTTANAMGAQAIDVTKGLNTDDISADTTYTLSGAPATANTWFSLHVTNTDTAPHLITLPAGTFFSQVTQAARTVIPIAASGQLWLTFRYDGTNYKIFGDSGFFNKYDATVAPAVTDDVADGYGPGSFWYDATANKAYICESNGAGAAVWTRTGASLSQTDAGFSFGPIATVADTDYVITCKAPHGGTLTDLAAKTDSGTCTVTWKINTTAVTTGVNSATSTISAVTPSAANVFAAGDILKVTVSANSTALNLQLAARYTRTLG